MLFAVQGITNLCFIIKILPVSQWEGRRACQNLASIIKRQEEGVGHDEENKEISAEKMDKKKTRDQEVERRNWPGMGSALKRTMWWPRWPGQG